MWEKGSFIIKLFKNAQNPVGKQYEPSETSENGGVSD